MTPEQSDDLDAALDRFEARLRRKWGGIEQRMSARRRKYLDAVSAFSEIHFEHRALKPSLDYYDNMKPARR